MFVDDNKSNLTSASNEASFSSSSRNETGIIMYPQQSFASTPQTQVPTKKKRNLPGNPDPEAEVIALSPRALMATNRFVCEICNKGFQRDQNLQLHRRGHNLPWKLKQRSNKEVIKKKVYVCPEIKCVHHEPSRALGDLTGIKKHFCRKHGEKKWKCEKCSKKYAVQSDWKAHSKICGTREYRCDCGTLFSRRDSFITHRAFCDALAEEGAKISSANQFSSSILPPHFNLHQPPTLFHNNISVPEFQPKREIQEQSNNFNLIRPENINPPWLGSSGHDLSSQLFSPHANPNSSLNPTLPAFPPATSSSHPHLSATALLQKAAQMGVTMSQPFEKSGNGNNSGFVNATPGGFLGQGSGTNVASNSLLHEMMASTDQRFGGSTSFQEEFDGILTNRSNSNKGGGNEELTRDFLGLRAFPHNRDHFINMASFDHMSNNSSYHPQNQNHNSWQG